MQKFGSAWPSSFDLADNNDFFFFQAEDGIRDHCVTGVQTCALPISKGYQISQYESPIVQGGSLRILAAHLGNETEKTIRLTRAHLEEDAGKSLHELDGMRSEEHTSELQSHSDLVCRLLLEKKNNASI